MERIIVGLDESESAADALEWAAREGSLRDAPVVAAMAWGLLSQHHPDRTSHYDPDYDQTAARAALAAYVHDVLGEHPPVPVEQIVVNDLPSRGLLELSQGAGLLVVGARGLGGFRSLLLGSVSQQCLHHATCPVAVVRGNWAARHGDRERVVVGVDGSDTALAALRWAAAEAKARHAGLEVVHAWHPPYVAGYPYTAAPYDYDSFEHAARRTLDEAVDALDMDGLAEPVERILVNGVASTALLDTAKGADLVVVGSRGLGGFAGLLLGSVAHQVAHHAECPVVVIPPTG